MKLDGRGPAVNRPSTNKGSNPKKKSASFWTFPLPPPKVYKSPSTSADEAPYYSTIYPNSRTPSSLAWVQRTQAGLRPNPHVSWPSATTILQCAASLATGGYNRPCGPIKSLFLLITRGANNSGPDYTAPSCPTEQLTYSFISRVDFHTLLEGGAPPLRSV